VDAMREAHLLLYTLGALDKDGAITEVGRKMNAFPVEVKLAKVWMDGAGQGNKWAGAAAGCMSSGVPCVVTAGLLAGGCINTLSSDHTRPVLYQWSSDSTMRVGILTETCLALCCDF
jgi:hypothetical protein